MRNGMRRRRAERVRKRSSGSGGGRFGWLRLPSGRPGPRVVRWTVVVLLAVCAVLVPRYAPPLLAEVEFFRVEGVDVEGLRYVDPAEIVRYAAVDTATSVWDDPEIVRLRVAAHAAVESVSIRRALPNRLVLDVVEREPMGLVPTPTLEPIDAEGRYLPLDPARLPLDLPLMIPLPDSSATTSRPDSTRLGPLIALTGTLSREPSFWSRLSELRQTEDGAVARVVVPELEGRGTPEVTFHMDASIGLTRLQQGMAALSDALVRHGERVPVAVDLRWAGQVVIRFRDS